jgi:hypothetical protein
LALTLVHVALALRFPLASDESYYWEWSRSLAWGYYDQAPLVAWLIAASTAILGHTELGVRAGAIACASVTLWWVYLAARRLFGERAGTMALLMAGVTPMGLAGGFTATYDVPLGMCWAGALLCLATLSDPTRPKWTPWLALGLLAGIGTLSKYTMVLLVPCALLCLAGGPAMRPWLRRPHPWVAMAIALVLVTPNLVWQAQHAWVSFGHMTGLTAKGAGSTPLKRIGDYVGSQVGLMTPLLFLGMAAALWSAARIGARRTRGEWLTFCLGAPVLVLFGLLAARTKVQANWALCGWIAASVCYAGWVWGDQAPDSRRRRGFAWSGIGMAVAISLFAGWPEARSAVGLRVPAKLDQSRKMYGGRELAAACAREIRAMAHGSEPPVVGAVTYDVASRMAYYIEGKPRAYCFFLGTRDNQYRFLNAAAGMRAGRNALIADHRPPDDPLLAPFDAVFERVEPVADPVVVRVPRIYDEPVVTYYLYRCYGYRPDR